MRKIKLWLTRFGEWLAVTCDDSYEYKVNKSWYRRQRNKHRVEEMHGKTIKVINDKNLDFYTKKSVLAIAFYQLAEELE